MRQTIKFLLSIFVLIAILAGAYWGYTILSGKYFPKLSQPTAQAADETSKKQLEPAPDFTVTKLDGTEVKLSDFRGKPVIINFWATWCPYCIEELPDFAEVYAGLKDEVAFLMVDAVDGRRETVAKGSAFIADNGYTFPVYYDTKQSAVNAYGIYSYPTTIFIDKNGYIVAGQEGKISKDTLLKGISLIQP